MELLIIDSTSKKLEESNNLYFEKNKKYYRDVIDFLNLLFECNYNEISKIKCEKITINDNIFIFYNEIIKKYNLKKPEFILENFNIEEIENPEEIKDIFYEIAYKLSNNLLEKLNYKMKKKIDKSTGKIKFIIVYNSK